ncbi:MAG: DNA repair protein RecN [Elusimicrobiaceae bacterium]|nr:DNA repair protein RecN [Elusimicrobiaceae bacterium]
MLSQLSVKNYAVIDSLDIKFGPGLNVFSGETGAGKSVLVGALGFVLGVRAGVSAIRPGAAKLEVTAVFENCRLDSAVCSRYGIGGGRLLLRRELDAKGRGRAFIGSVPVTVSALADIGAELVDFHGQHDHQTLLRPALHLELLDRFAGLDGKTGEIAALVRRMRELENGLKALTMSRGEKERLLDLYRFQLDEIESAGVTDGEDLELETALPRAKNADKLAAQCALAREILYDAEGSAVEKTGEAVKLIAELAALDPELAALGETLAGALAALEDAAAGIKDYGARVNADPAELDRLLARDERLKRLKAKYGPGLDDVLEFAAGLRRKTEELDFSELKETEVRAELEAINAKLLPLCEKLHAARMSAAGKLSGRIIAQIRPLGFADVDFAVSVEMDGSDIRESGADRVEFLFSANPGSPLMPLKNIASGGELSRVMLGLKTVLAGADRVPVLVFDEIDAGIGGETGALVGEKLARIGRVHQVLCVTHLATVAACAAGHYNVEKKSAAGVTNASVKRLDGDARVREIARMLGSRDAGDAALRLARELLKNSVI